MGPSGPFLGRRFTDSHLSSTRFDGETNLPLPWQRAGYSARPAIMELLQTFTDSLMVTTVVLDNFLVASLRVRLGPWQNAALQKILT